VPANDLLEGSLSSLRCEHGKASIRLGAQEYARETAIPWLSCRWAQHSGYGRSLTVDCDEGRQDGPLDRRMGEGKITRPPAANKMPLI
jgi:hypothetical protein